MINKVYFYAIIQRGAWAIFNGVMGICFYIVKRPMYFHGQY